MFGSMEKRVVETDPFCLLVYFYSHFNVLKKQLVLSNPEIRKLFLTFVFCTGLQALIEGFNIIGASARCLIQMESLA